jgi:hypothetical protein
MNTQRQYSTTFATPATKTILLSLNFNRLAWSSWVRNAFQLFDGCTLRHVEIIKEIIRVVYGCCLFFHQFQDFICRCFGNVKDADVGRRRTAPLLQQNYLHSPLAAGGVVFCFIIIFVQRKNSEFLVVLK